MGILRFRLAEKQKIEFGKAFVKFIRETDSIQFTDITYSNGTGQNIGANEILYESGTIGIDGYIQIKSTNSTVLNGSGLMNLTIIHKCSSTQVDQNISFDFAGGNINILFSYNSNPESLDINKDLPNRSVYTFDWINDFENNYSDYDLDELYQVAVFGDVTRFELSGISYIEGTFIPRPIIDAGEFKYKALDQNASYESNNTWKSKDTNLNISNEANLIFKVDGVGEGCISPVLTVATVGSFVYELTWNYQGIDYSIVDPTTMIYVQVSIGSSGSFQNIANFPYTTQSYTYDDSVEANKILYFRLILINTNCEIYSNRVGITNP